ncbi:MAG: MFS transporter [Thermoanaerobaculaceae bacterium]
MARGWGYAFRALRCKHFRRYWLGWSISVLGSWMQTLAQGWLLYRITGSPQALGYLTALRFGPALLGLPFAGVLTDFFPRRRLLLFTQTASIAQATVLAWLTLAREVTVWHILLLALFQGVVDALDMPARQSFQAELVPVEDLQSAVSLNSSVFNVGRSLGPALAGLVVARYGEGWCFALNAASFVPFLLALLSVPESAKADLGQLQVFPQLFQGFRFALGDSKIRWLLAAVFVTAVFGLAYVTLLPAYAKAVLNLDARGYGLLLTASGLGATVGSLSVAARGGSRGTGVFFSQALLGTALVGLMWAETLALAAGALLVAGWAVAAQLATTNGYIQTHSPPPLRARLLSIYIWLFSGGTPLGGLWAGWLAQRLGTSQALGIGGGLCLLFAGLLTMAKRPRLQCCGGTTR